MNIAILGAGIIGLTSAHTILEKLPNVKVTIYARERSPNTTSDVSAGYWEPYCLDESEEQIDRILKWGKETYDIMLKTALSQDSKKSGVQTMSAYVMQNTEKVKTPFWSTIVSQYWEIPREELSSIVSNENTSAKSAFHFTTTTVNVEKYMSLLTQTLEDKGVTFVDKTLTTLLDFIKETREENYDYVVNCTGLGARELCNDLKVHPVRGQVLRVKAPWIKSCLMMDNEISYILPLDDLVVLGGSQEMDVYDLVPNDNDCEAILERCCKISPSLKDAEIVRKASGLRPYREEGIRLELEIITSSENGCQTKVIHNYGHGGSGITLSWGCAANVAEILLKELMF